VAGANTTSFLGGAFRKAKYEIRRWKARAGKNSFPPTPFLFARPSVQFGARSAPSVPFKKCSDFNQKAPPKFEFRTFFEECQEVMKNKSKPQKADKMKFFLYRGFFRCGECGFTITADRKIKKSGKQYVYYYCTKKNPNHICSQNVFTREEKISSQIKKKFKKFLCPMIARIGCSTN
jgi:hypothetical protein